VQRDPFLAADIVRELTELIFPAAGTAGLALLADLLEAAVAEQSDGAQDYSYIWRPFLNGERRRDLRDALVSAVRDASASVVGAEPEHLGEIVELLEGHESSIFKRLALDLLARHPDSELIAARLTSRDLLGDLNVEREYDAVARTHFAALDDEAKDEILESIDAGPERGADDADYVGRWRLHTLRRFPEPLPDAWHQRVDELVGEYGEPEPEVLPEIGCVGPNSPLGRDELRATACSPTRWARRKRPRSRQAGRTPQVEG
jgi:hypothetical protein